MPELQLYAVHGGDLSALAVPEAATDVHGLFEGQGGSQATVRAIYSALRSYQQTRFLRLNAHMQRCLACAERAGFDTHFALGGLARAIHAAVSERPPGDVRVRFDLFERPVSVQGIVTQVLLGLAPHEPVAPSLLRDGVRLGLAPAGLSRAEPLIKFSAWVDARRVCWQNGSNAYEHLLVDEDRRILEGTSSNFFAVRGHRLMTAGDAVLEGITRQIVLELAERRDLVIELRRLPFEELEGVDEAFITSSTREVVPVSRVESLSIGAGKPGPVTLALMADYRLYADDHARPARFP